MQSSAAFKCFKCMLKNRTKIILAIRFLYFCIMQVLAEALAHNIANAMLEERAPLLSGRNITEKITAAIPTQDNIFGWQCDPGKIHVLLLAPGRFRRGAVRALRVSGLAALCGVLAFVLVFFPETPEQQLRVDLETDKPFSIAVDRAGGSPDDGQVLQVINVNGNRVESVLGK